MAWGYNEFGQCDVPEPNSGFVAIAAGYGFSLAIRPESPEVPEAQFVRGDSTAGGALDIADPIRILGYLFASGLKPSCLDWADANDDGAVDLDDAVYLLYYLLGWRTISLDRHLAENGQA